MLASSFAFASIAALAVARPISVSLAAVEAVLALPNTTQTDNVTYYWQNGNAGACGLYSKDTDKVVGLPYEFYSDLGAVSPYCGTYIMINNAINNLTVAARVADASATNGTLSLSVATWRALNGDGTNMTSATWRFANKTETAAAEAAVEAEASASAASAAAPQTTQQAQQQQTQQQQAQTQASQPKPSTQAYVAPTTTTTQYYAPKTTTKAWTPSPSPTQAYKSSSASSGTYSGTATYFYQGGQAGNCGTVHQDSDYIVALTSSMYSGGSHCGQGVRICTSSGSCVSATVADSCPSCTSSGDLDLSVAAFQAISNLNAGVASITWSFT